MRLLPGQPKDIANESISSYNLMTHAVVDPDIFTTVFRLFPEEASLSSLFDELGLKTSGLFEKMNNGSYRVVKSNVIQYPIANTKRRKQRFVAVFSNGACYKSDAYPTTPGKDQTVFYIYLDTNWAGPKEVIELADNNTLVYVVDDAVPQEYNGSFCYAVKLVTGTNTDYVNVDLLQEGMECTPTMTMYEHDFSETGVEKYTFDGWGTCYLTLQRLKYSWSGTAAAMKEGMKWTVHNGQVSFLSNADYLMMKRAAEYHNYAMLFGKRTVNVDGEVIMKDLKGREVMAGDGIVNSGDGAYEYPIPYSGYTMKFFDSIMDDIDVRSGKDGLLKVAVACGNAAMREIQNMLIQQGYVTQNNNVEGTGAEKGVNNSYSFIEYNGVRFIFKKQRFFDAEYRPSVDLGDGTRRSSHDAIFIPLGVDDNGNNGIEMVALRGLKKGTVKGIDAGGDIASSVDGSHTHILFQAGVICRNKIARAFKPMPVNDNPIYYDPQQNNNILSES